MNDKIMISRALKGPVRRLAAEDVMDCYVVWDFAGQRWGAAVPHDLIDAFQMDLSPDSSTTFPVFPVGS